MNQLPVGHCLEVGGHCFPDYPVAQQGPAFLFLCKHCGSPQWKAQRNSWFDIIAGEIESGPDEGRKEE